MNIMTSEKFAELEQGAATETNPALKKLMEQWEKKLFKNARRAGGFGMIAVTLAACGGSGGSGGTGDGENGENGGGENGGGTTPIPDGGTFTVLDFPTEVESGLFFPTASGGLASVDELVTLLTGAVEAINAGEDSGDVSVGEVQNILDNITTGGGDVVINVGSDGGAQDFATVLNSLVNSGLLAGIEQVDVTSVGRVVLTPEFNSGDITDGLSGDLDSAVPGAGDDTIIMGRTELLHGAIINAGDGADTLQITTKTPYAQPAFVANVETIDIRHQPDASLSQLPSGVNTSAIVNGSVTSTDFLLPNLAAVPFNAATDSWLDLGAAIDVETVKISESGGGGGDLFVIGVNNDATLELAGGFSNNVTVDFGFSTEATSVVLNNVNFGGTSTLQVVQNSTALILESTGGDSAVENFISSGFFGPNLREMTITGDVSLNIAGPVIFNTNSATTIDAGENTGGVQLTAANSDPGDSPDNNTIDVTGSQGDDDFTLTADAFNITSGAGSNIFNLTGSDIGPLVQGMQLNFDGAAGSDTIVLNANVGQPFFNAMLSGSSITGADNNLVVNANYSLTEATLEGIASVDISPVATLAVTGAQVGALGAGVFSMTDADEFVADPNFNGSGPTLAIVLESGDDVTLSDLIDPTALDSNVKLGFRIPEGATLTLTAEELHTYVANPGILMGNNDGSQLQSAGELVITDAGPNFNPFDTTDVDAPGLGLLPGGGAVVVPPFGSDNNVTIERSEGGFERPSQDPLDDVFTIDSSDGPIEVGANAIGDSSDEFSVPQTGTLEMVGDNDITFTAPVSFDGQTNFTVDFGIDPDDPENSFTGTVTGLEIVDFHNITDGNDPDEWGQVIGNGDARIDVQLDGNDGNVGNANNGLISSGVATYVVTDLNGQDRQFWTSTPTEDVETLGLQGNYGNGITFGNVIASVDFLMEVTSDKFDPAYSVGELTVVFARDDVADAVVNVVGLEDLPEGEVQTVQGITLGAVNGNVPASATINVAGGDTIIESLTGAFPELTITGDGDVTVEGTTLAGGVFGDDLPATLTTINVSDVSGVFTATIDGTQAGGVTIDEAFSFTGAEGGTVLTLEDLDGAQTFANTIDGGVGGAELIIQDGVDLSISTLSNISSVTLTNGSDLTMTPQQVIDLGGLSSFNIEDGDTADLTLTVTDDFNVDDLDLENLPEGVNLDLSIQSGAELEITGEQLVALFEAGVTISDGSGSDPAGTVNVIDVNQTHLPFPVVVGENDHLSVIDADVAGTITLEAGAEVYIGQGYENIPGTDDNLPGAFDWELSGGTLGISYLALGDELTVNGGDLKFFVINFDQAVDALNYTDIGMISVPEGAFTDSTTTPPTFNTEIFTSLDSDTDIEIVPLAIPEFEGVDRTLFVGGVPFAIDDGTGAPFNPATGDAGPVTDGVNLLFDNVSTDENFNVETVTIFFQEGGNIVGDITIGDGELPDGNAFETLTLFSNGDDVNTVGNILATGNNLVDDEDGNSAVTINASQEFVAQTITLSSIDADLDEATVTITGAADVTVKGVVAGTGVNTLTVDTTGHTGTYTVTGGSPSIDAGETLVFVGGADSTVELDTADLTPPDDGNLGVDGNDDLLLLDASGMEGTLSLGDVNNLAEGFTLTGGTGVITGNIIALPSDDWSLDISGSAAGSALDLVLDGDAATLTAGSLALETDDTVSPSENTLTFGDNTTLLIEGVLDLTSGFNNVVFGDDVTIELAEGGLVLMSDEQYADFVAANGDITGELSVIFDNDTPNPPGNDLTEVRGLEEIGLEEGSGAYTLTSEQVGIAFPVDGDGEPTTADPGDINALKDDPGLTVQVNEGETFNLTDVEADGLSVTGEGSVTINVIGNAGADFTITASENNDSGQSITIPFTLDGDDDEVVLTNTAVNFTQPGAMATALATAFSAIDGLTASSSAGTLNVEADEAGVPFTIGTIDVDGGDDLAVDVDAAASSDANMGGVVVVDTTHVFDGDDFDLTGADLAGGPDEDGNVTVTLQGDSFIDASQVGSTPSPTGTGTTSIVIDGDAELKLDDSFLNGVSITSTGAGFVQVQDPEQADLSGVEVPVTFLLTADATFTGEFNGGQTVTVTDPAESDPELELDIQSATGLPSSFVLEDTALELTVDQADGLTITGGSTAIVIVDQSDTNAVLSTISSDVDLVMDVSNGDSDFGGELPAGDLTVTGGNTLTFKPEVNVTVSSITVTGGTTLALTGAQASELTIEGDGNVTLTDVLAGQDLSGLSVTGDVTVQFDDDTETEFTLPASAISGSTVDVENVGGDIDTLTITGVEDSDADFGNLTVTAGGGAGDVVLELDSTDDDELGADADFGITSDSTSGDVTLAISGTGSVTVDGADLTGIDAYTVEEDATLVVDASATGDAVVDTSRVSGEGTLQFVELGGQTATATEDVRFNEFVFESTDTGVTIEGFEAVGAIDGFFVFDAGPVLGSMSLDLSSFTTTGTGFDTIPDNATTTDLTGVGVIVVENGDDPVGMNFSGDNGGNAQIFFAHDFGVSPDTRIEYWDDAGGNGDGIVDPGELTVVATLDQTQPDQLGSENFTL